MELKEFISNTLSDIMEGVADAQKRISLPKAIVIPHDRSVFYVDFEVKLSDELKEKECGSDNFRTHIKFSIPIYYPVCYPEIDP